MLLSAVPFILLSRCGYLTPHHVNVAIGHCKPMLQIRLHHTDACVASILMLQSRMSASENYIDGQIRLTFNSAHRVAQIEAAFENNATLYCYPNGTWSRISFYNDCLNVVMNNTEERDSTTVSTSQTIFYIGNSLSLVAVTLALWIFISFKDLRCLRNTIHTNLLFTYLLHNLFWIVYASVQTMVNESIGCTFFVALSYFNLTNFMWMFVEGLYLYMLVVKTFSVENIKLRVYTLIGWGIPVAIIITWVILKSNLTVAHTGPEAGVDVEGLLRTCPLMPVSHVDWIQKVPVLFFLSTNFIFLMRIMWVLITKLRSANTVETQRYRKATKALLVLIPLLGLTYMLLIALPQELEHVRAILLSTQGFWVAVFFCFLNSEVQNSIRHHIERWKTERGITDPRNPSIRLSRDGSPRPRTVCSRQKRRLYIVTFTKKDRFRRDYAANNSMVPFPGLYKALENENFWLLVPALRSTSLDLFDGKRIPQYGRGTKMQNIHGTSKN
nr:diuretic hormone receptor-like [Penaeus vannamei]